MLAWHQYLIGLLFIIAGLTHFKKTKMYERIMPTYIPARNTMVLASGMLEMVLGLMILNPETQALAAWCIIIMLVLFLSIHIHMLQHKEASLKLPKWILILRIPLQFGLIYWAYQYV